MGKDAKAAAMRQQGAVRLGRRPQQREGVVAFPCDRAFGAAIGQRRWLKARVALPFRPRGLLVWGVSDPPPAAPTPDAPPAPVYSWCNRLMIGGRDELVMHGGFALHYFRVPRTFEQLIATLSTPTGERLPGPFEDSFLGVVHPDVSIRSLLLIPQHCELDFSTALAGDDLAIEVSGPLERVVAWGGLAL